MNELAYTDEYQNEQHQSESKLKQCVMDLLCRTYYSGLMSNFINKKMCHSLDALDVVLMKRV